MRPSSNKIGPNSPTFNFQHFTNLTLKFIPPSPVPIHTYKWECSSWKQEGWLFEMDAWERKENIQIYLLVTGDEALVKKLGRSSRLSQNSQTLHKSSNMLYCFTIVTCLFGIFISHSSASTVLSYLVQVKEWYCNLKSHRFFCSRKEKIDKSGRASQVQIKENGLGRREGVSTMTLAFVGRPETVNSQLTVP